MNATRRLAVIGEMTATVAASTPCMHIRWQPLGRRLRTARPLGRFRVGQRQPNKALLTLIYESFTESYTPELKEAKALLGAMSRIGRFSAQ